jgi:hypothetical protein
MSLPIPVRPRAAASLGRGLAALAAAAAALLWAACGGGTGDAVRSNGDTAPGGAVETYEVRGVVLAVPDPSDPLSNLEIRHEAIDDFRSIDGEIVGMDSMRMAFPVAEGVDLAGIAPDDKVAFTLEVEWEGEPPYRVARIEELPADTELEFRKASPPGGGGGDPD